MNNYERIKNMSIEEMAEHLREFQDNPVYLCTLISPCKRCTYEDCLINAKQWLESEVRE